MARLLTTGDVAKLCQVTIPAVLKWIKAEKLKAYHTPGGKNKIHPHDLLEFMRDSKMLIPSELEALCQRPKILIIDDDQSLHLQFLTVNDRLGKIVELYHSYDGFDGLYNIGKLSPTIIILDIHMPKMDGFALLHALSKNRQIYDEFISRIIVVSSYLNSETHQKEKLTKLGVEEILEKPVKLDTIAEFIKSCSESKI